MPPKRTTPAKAPVKKGGAAKPAAKKPAAAAAPAATKGDKKEEPAKEPQATPKHITIGKKEIAKTLVEDESGEIRKEGKTVLVIDNEEHIAARFLPYSGGNVLEASDRSHMEKERIRMAVVGAVRFGKPLAIDFGETGPDMMEPLATKFDAVQEGLLDKCLSREITKRDPYHALLTDSDDENYTVATYYDFENEISAKFIFIILMKNAVYPKDFTNKFYTVSIEQD